MPSYYSFEVTLLGVKPRIWRGFLLRDTSTFHDLHEAIQRACGWQNCHLHEFWRAKRGDVIAGIPDPSGLSDPAPDAKRVKLRTYFENEIGTRCVYEYDFGDGWTHEVVLTQILERAGTAKRTLLGGDRAFPPEDCGGLYGYERCVAAATGKRWTKSMGDSTERAELIEWLGDWKPDAFDLIATKKAFDF